MRKVFACVRTQLAMLPQVTAHNTASFHATTSRITAQQAPLASSVLSRRQVSCWAASGRESAACSRDSSTRRLQSLQHNVGVRATGLAPFGFASLPAARPHATSRRLISTSCSGRDTTTTSAAAAALAPSPTSRIAESGSLTLTLSSGAFELPHPEKVSRGGEDAHFVADCNTCVGVADGVGGWAEVGVDAGTYAKMLMRLAKYEADHGKHQHSNLDPQNILEVAYKQTDVQGSATACIVCLHPHTNELLASNLGDSGFLLVRDGQIAFQSPPQQHDFNFPFQLGSVGSMSDPPEAAQHFRVAVEPGDTLVVGTDGLFDNVFAEETAAIVYQCLLQQATADVTAQVLVQYARMRAADRKYPSPFAQAAFQNGFSYMGGKMDDITVVVSYLEPSPAPLAKL